MERWHETLHYEGGLEGEERIMQTFPMGTGGKL